MSEIKDILTKYKTIAMIGVSKDPTKPSTIVMKYMQKYGFKVYPVNPRAEGKKILGKILNANKGKGIILETTTRKKIGNKKKQIIEQQSLSFDEIDRTKVVISF